MNSSDITNIVDTAMIVLFAGVILILLLSFLRGLFRGWRYGTFRLIAFAILILIAFICLEPEAMALGNANLSGFGIPAIDFWPKNSAGDSYHVYASFGSPFGVLTSVITTILQGNNVHMDPTEISNYAIALSMSIVEIVILLLDAFLISTFGSLFVLLLWHIGFKHIIPKEKRKATYKEGRLWSAFEEVVVSGLVLTLFLMPLTGMANAFANGWDAADLSEDEKTQLKADNDTYSEISDVVDAYDNSVFAKAFFSWAKDDSGESYDTQILSFVTKGEYGDASVSFVNEFSTAVKAFSYATAGGLLNKDGVTNTALALFLTSSYAPRLLRTIGQSSLVDGLMPVGLAFALNIDSIATYLATDEGIDFTKYDYADTFSELADIYQDVIDSGILSNVVDSSGNLISDPNTLSNVLTTQYQGTMHKIIGALSDDKLRLLDALIEAAVYVEACHEYDNEAATPDYYKGQIALKDFLPVFTDYDTNGNKVPDAIPASISGIDWSHEIVTLYDSFEEVVAAAPEALPYLFEPLTNNGTMSEADLKAFTNVLIDHVDAIEGAIVGTEGSSDPCLFDSSFLENGLPKLMTILQDGLNSSLSLTGDHSIDISGVTTALNKQSSEADLVGQTARYKTEFRSLLDVVKSFLTSADGKALVENLNTLPGLYFTPDSDHTFLGAKAGLIDDFAAALRKMDDSKIASAILPKILNNYMTGASSPLASFGADLTLDFSVNNLGSQLADIVTTYGSCQDLIAYLSSLTSVSGGHDADVAMQTLTSYKTANGDYQLFTLLDLFATSKILNPTTKDTHGATVYNANIYALINTMLTKTVGDYSTEIQSVIESSSFDATSEISALVGFIAKAGQYDLVEAFEGASSGGISSLSSVDFADLFSTLSDGSIMRSCLGSILDSKLTSTGLLSGDVSFTNVTDWAKEGASIDALVKAAADIGDLSNIDYFASDASSITAILKVLASSQIFVKKDGTYLFPSYIADKLTASLAGNSSIGPFFTDEGETYDSASPFDTLKTDIRSVATVAGWAGDGSSLGEADILGSLIADNASMGGIDSFKASADLSGLNALVIKDFMVTASSSQAFGRVLTAHLFQEVTDAIVDSGESAFSLSNVAYLWSGSTTAAEREAEAAKLGDIVEVILDPTYGLLNASGQLQFSLDFDTVSPDFLVKPLLKALASSKVFNTAQSGQTETAFEKELAKTLVDTTYYPNEATALYVIKGVGGWNSEINHLCDALDAVKAMGLTLDGDFNFDAVFASGYEAGRVEVYNLLSALNASTLLYKALPSKIQKALASASSAASSTALDFSDANVYYEGTDATYPALSAAPYGEDEWETLSYVFADVYALKASSFSDLASVDASTLSDLLASMAKSHVFNSVAASKANTVFDDTMGLVFGNDQMKDLYFDAASPKDTAADNAAAANYSSSKTKAIYTAKALYPALSAATDGRTLDTANLDGASSGSLLNVMKTIQTTSGLSAALEGGSVTTLSETSITSLLKALNACDWTSDLTSNLIAKSLTDSAISVSSIDLTKAAPYYFYTYDGTSYGVAANYARKMDDGEIDILSSIIVELKDEKGLLSALAATPISSEAQIQGIRALLTNLDASSIFMKAGAEGVSDPSLVTSAAGLPVFEQVMYLIYDSSQLAGRAYNPVYDSTYADYGAKLLGLIKAYPAADWVGEIGHLTANEAGTSGLLQAAYSEGLLASGTNFSSGSLNFAAISPSVMKELITQLNSVDMVSSIVGYESSALMGETIGLKTYSTATYDYSGLNANSVAHLGGLAAPVYSLAVTVSDVAAPTVTYGKAGGLVSAAYSQSGSVYTFDLSADKPTAYTIKVGSGLITDVVASFNTADYFIGQSGYANGGIDALYHFASLIYDSGTSSYPNLGTATAFTDFMTSGSDKVRGIFTYVGDPKGFFTTGYTEGFLETNSVTPAFEARDLTIRQVLSFTYSDPSLGSLTIDLPKYLPHGGSANKILLYEDINGLMSVGSAAAASAWLSANVGDLLSLDAILQKTTSYDFAYGGTTYALPKAHALMEAVSKDDLLYKLVDATQPYATWQSELISGMAANLTSQVLSYAEGGTYFYAIGALTKPSSTATPSLRSSDHLASAAAFSVGSSNYAAVLSQMKAILKITDALRFSEMASSGVNTLSPADKLAVASSLESFQDLDETSGIVPIIYYQGIFYDYFVNRGYFHAAIPLVSSEVDAIAAPFGATGYFASAGGAILTA